MLCMKTIENFYSSLEQRIMLTIGYLPHHFVTLVLMKLLVLRFYLSYSGNRWHTSQTSCLHSHTMTSRPFKCPYAKDNKLKTLYILRNV